LPVRLKPNSRAASGVESMILIMTMMMMMTALCTDGLNYCRVTQTVKGLPVTLSYLPNARQLEREGFSKRLSVDLGFHIVG
jgi:hypothetical protein